MALQSGGTDAHLARWCEVDRQCQKVVRTVLAHSWQNLINPILIIIAIVLEFNLFLNTTHSIINIILNIK